MAELLQIALVVAAGILIAGIALAFLVYLVLKSQRRLKERIESLQSQLETRRSERKVSDDEWNRLQQAKTEKELDESS